MYANKDFRLIVRKAMSTVMDAYGYDVVESESDDCYVRLDSTRSSIQVLYDCHHSFEVAVTFSELENGCLLRRVPFNLGEVFRECEVPDSPRHCYFQSTEISKVEEFLTATSDLLLRYCDSILNGDPQAFAAVNERRKREAAAYTNQVQIDSVRKQADDAWRNQRYEEFISLLREYKDWLSDADRRKFEYASKKIVAS